MELRFYSPDKCGTIVEKFLDGNIMDSSNFVEILFDIFVWLDFRVYVKIEFGFQI